MNPAPPITKQRFFDTQSLFLADDFQGVGTLKGRSSPPWPARNYGPIRPAYLFAHLRNPYIGAKRGAQSTTAPALADSIITVRCRHDPDRPLGVTLDQDGPQGGGARCQSTLDKALIDSLDILGH
jgi:hypothetical protein